MLTLDKDTGIISQAEFIASPNFDARPEATEIDLLVVHGISLPPNEFGGPGIIQCFTNQLNPDEHPYYEEIKHLRVSSHVLIRRDGALIQFVSFNDRAWHAGKSSFEGRTACNNFSIGVELEGADDIAYQEAQYQTLIILTQVLMAAYPKITKQRIVGHSDISPGRKTDPGEHFNWQRFKAGVNV